MSTAGAQDGVMVLGDGSELLVHRSLAPDAPHASEPVKGTLAAPEITEFVTDAILGGITFDVLKTVLTRLAKREHVPQPAEPAAASDVEAAVARHLLGAGYLEVAVTETRHVDGSGWILRGFADEQPFQAMSEETGRIIHLRFG